MAESKTTDLSTYKWLFIVQGLVFLLFGWLILTRPVGTVLTLIQILGIFWLISGVIEMIRAVVDQEGNKGLRILGGIVGLLAGILVINNTALTGILTTTFLVYFISFSFIINGVIRAVLGSKRGKSGEFKWSFGNLLLGLLYVVLGIAILGAEMKVAISTLVLIVGWLAIINGVGSLILPFFLKDENN